MINPVCMVLIVIMIMVFAELWAVANRTAWTWRRVVSNFLLAISFPVWLFVGHLHPNVDFFAFACFCFGIFRPWPLTEPKKELPDAHTT